MAARSIRVASFCSGYGGFELAVRRVFRNARTVVYVERETYAAAVLATRMEAGDLDAAPIWSDLVTFDAAAWRGCVDLFTAGFPCQPHSVAGQRRGIDDERWIWPDLVRCIRDMGPSLVALENVPGLVTSGGLDAVACDLAALGYRFAWDVYSAAEVGAPHLRERLFILAHAGCLGADWLQSESIGGGCDETATGGSGEAVADAEHVRRGECSTAHDNNRSDAPRHDAHGCHAEMADADGSGRQGSRCSDSGRGVASSAGCFPPGPDDVDGWRRHLERYPSSQPAIRRDANGTANRLDRLRLLGNGIVPQQAELALRDLWERLTHV